MQSYLSIFGRVYIIILRDFLTNWTITHVLNTHHSIIFSYWNTTFTACNFMRGTSFWQRFLISLATANFPYIYIHICKDFVGRRWDRDLDISSVFRIILQAVCIRLETQRYSIGRLSISVIPTWRRIQLRRPPPCPFIHNYASLWCKLINGCYGLYFLHNRHCSFIYYSVLNIHLYL